MRLCKVCKQKKHISEFQKLNKNRDWYRNECNLCIKQRSQIWFVENYESQKEIRKQYYIDKEKIRRESPKIKKEQAKKQRDRNANKRKIVFNYYGNKCACCGELEEKFLTIDHINNDGYWFRKNNKHKSGVNFYNFLIIHNFPNDFQLLCMNCNFGKSLNNGICPHKNKEGSTISYNNVDSSESKRLAPN